MRSARCCLPGSYLRPAEPTPATSPKEAPLRATHSLPFGPSLTNGIRSLSSRDDSAVKRSGGNQIMSRWQSAEIRLYCICFNSPWRIRHQWIGGNHPALAESTRRAKSQRHRSARVIAGGEGGAHREAMGGGGGPMVCPPPNRLSNPTPPTYPLPPPPPSDD